MHPYKTTALLLVCGDPTVEEVLENIFHVGQSSQQAWGACGLKSNA